MPDADPHCSRCHVRIPTHGWEHGWPLCGRIHLGFPAQAFAALAAADHCADEDDFTIWQQGHPALTTNDAQEVVFEWGNGYKYTNPSGYRLCYGCQKVLLNLVGWFFGFPQAVARLRETLGERWSDTRPVSVRVGHEAQHGFPRLARIAKDMLALAKPDAPAEPKDAPATPLV